MKDYDKNKKSYIQYWDVKNLYGWAMSQKLPVNNSEWAKDTSQFNEYFIKNCNEESDEVYFLENNVKFLEKLNELHNDLSFLLEKLKKLFGARTKSSYYKVFHRKLISNRNEKN